MTSRGTTLKLLDAVKSRLDELSSEGQPLFGVVVIAPAFDAETAAKRRAPMAIVNDGGGVLDPDNHVYESRRVLVTVVFVADRDVMYEYGVRRTIGIGDDVVDALAYTPRSGAGDFADVLYLIADSDVSCEVLASGVALVSKQYTFAAVIERGGGDG
jgi:hypothetical protein